MEKHLNGKPEKRWITFHELFKRLLKEDRNTALTYLNIIMHIGAGYKLEGEKYKGIDLRKHARDLSEGVVSPELKEIVFDFKEVEKFDRDTTFCDIHYWSNMGYWTEYEAACLLNRCDPGKAKDADTFKVSNPKISEMVERIKRASEIGDIKRVGKGVEPYSTIRWARKRDIDLPKPLGLMVPVVHKVYEEKEPASETQEREKHKELLRKARNGEISKDEYFTELRGGLSPEEYNRKIFYKLEMMADAKEADFQFWKTLDSWTLNEAVHLLTGIDPYFTDEAFESSDRHTSNNPEFIKRLRIYIKAEKALIAGSLEGKKGDLRPKVFLEWASENGIPIPSELTNLEAKLGTGESLEPGFSFFNTGDFWMIGETGREIPLKDSKGLKCIHLLLQYENKDLDASVVDDGGVVPGDSPLLEDHHGSKVSKEAQIQKDATFYPKLDAKAIKAIRDKIEEFQERLSLEANIEKRETLQEQIESYQKHFKNNRHGFQSGPEEQARQRVSKAIAAALEKIKENCPKVHKILLRAISTGSTCRYNPSESISWKLYR